MGELDDTLVIYIWGDNGASMEGTLTGSFNELTMQNGIPLPWDATPDTMRQFAPGAWNPDDDPVELYYLPDDFAQANDLAAGNPEKVEELKALFWEEAERYKVTPLLGGMAFYFGILPPLGTQTTFTYYGPVQNVASGMIPRIYNHSYTISAELELPDGGAEGVIVAEADHLGGFSLFVEDGKLKHTYSMMGVFVHTQEAEKPLPSGDVNVQLVFAADEAKPATGGEVTLLVDDEPVAVGRTDHTVPLRFSGYSGWTSAVTTASPSTAATQQIAVRIHGDDQEGRLRPPAAPGRGGREADPRAHAPRRARSRDGRLRERTMTRSACADRACPLSSSLTTAVRRASDHPLGMMYGASVLTTVAPAGLDLACLQRTEHGRRT